MIIVEHEFEKEVSIPVVMGLGIALTSILQQHGVSPHGVVAVVRKEKETITAYIVTDGDVVSSVRQIIIRKPIAKEGEQWGLSILADGEVVGMIVKVPDLEVLDVEATIPLTEDIRKRVMAIVQEATSEPETGTLPGSSPIKA